MSPFDAETLLHMADEALDRAKQLGRNRVELAIAPEQDGPTSLAAESSLKSESR
jgi:hypothetical protein